MKSLKWWIWPHITYASLVKYNLANLYLLMKGRRWQGEVNLIPAQIEEIVKAKRSWHSRWEKPVRSTSRRRECPGYVCPFNTADRQAHKANKHLSEHVYECIQNQTTYIASYALAVYRRGHLKMQYIRIGHLLFSFSRQANRRQHLTRNL